MPRGRERVDVREVSVELLRARGSVARLDQDLEQLRAVGNICTETVSIDPPLRGLLRAQHSILDPGVVRDEGLDHTGVGRTEHIKPAHARLVGLHDPVGDEQARGVHAADVGEVRVEILRAHRLIGDPARAGDQVHDMNGLGWIDRARWRGHERARS